MSNLEYGTFYRADNQIFPISQSHEKKGRRTCWNKGLLIDANYCLWNGSAMRSCCTALGTISSNLWRSSIMWEKRMCVCVCVCVSDWVTLLCSGKLTEHCQLAIMEKKIIRTKKKRIYLKIEKIWTCLCIRWH